MNLKYLLKRIIQKTGYDLRRLNPRSTPSFQLFKALERFGINLVFDVGANKGQFAQDLYSVGYKGELASFEPLAEAYAELMKNTNEQANWRVHERGAIGDFDGEIEINVAGNSVSSSVLPMMEAHASASVKSAYVGSEKVSIFRLDSVTPGYMSATSRAFLKIDTQGFEWQVLDGASETLASAQGILCELSLVPLYEGQRLWLDMIKRIEHEGFTLWALQPGFTDPRDGRTLQADAIFFRVPE